MNPNILVLHFENLLYFLPYLFVYYYLLHLLLLLLKYLYNHYQISKHGVIYTHTDRKALEELGVEREKMKAYVNLFSGYKESRIWVSFTEDAEKNIWMVSIRSRKIPINMVAERHHGGGHANASGARVETYEETMQIIQELDDLLK